MKHPRRLALALALISAGAFQTPTVAEEPPRGAVAYGIHFLPLDFYPRHREELGLSEDQMREMQRIGEGMREPGEKIEAEMRERTRGLQEAIAQNPVDMEKATDRFQAVMKAENEMKALQFRSRMAMRKVLTPEQYAKVQPLAMKENASRGGGDSTELREKFEQVKREIRERIGSGEPPRELVEKLGQIERAAKEGRVGEAKEQLEAILRHLREERGSRESASAKRPETERRPGGEMEERQRKLAGEIEHATDPERREQLQREMRKLRENQERERGSAEGKRGEEGAPRSEREGIERRTRQIAEAAKRTDNPEVRERLEGAVKGLRDAAEDGNREAVEKIMRAIEPVLREAQPGGGRPRE